MKRILAAILALVLLTGIVPASADTYPTAVVKGGWLRLRDDASYDAETVSAYFTGTKVTIMGGSGSWYYVRTPDGKTGYMHADFLTVTGSITGGQLAENTVAYVTSGNGKAVRLRTGPSKQYSTIASYSVGTKVTVLLSGTIWCKVSVNGRTGYMMTEFLSREAVNVPTVPSTPTTGYTAYVTSKNGLGVRLRSGAGKLYTTLATYQVGTAVTVLEYGRTWSKVRAGTLTGYMMSEFLTTDAPLASISVKISASSIWPGETLYAEVTPAEQNANCYIEWINDLGTRIGTGSAYTVTTGDAGRKIRARVTSYGNAGTDVSGWATVQGNGYVSMAYQLKSVTISDTTPYVGQVLTAAVRPTGATAEFAWWREDGVYLGSGSSYTVRLSDNGYRLWVQAIGTGATTGNVTSEVTDKVFGGATPTPVPTQAPTASLLRVEGAVLSDLTPVVGQRLRVTVEPYDAMVIATWFRDDDKVLGYGDTYTVKAEDEGHCIYVWVEGTGGTFGSATTKITQPVEANVSLIVPVS